MEFQVKNNVKLVVNFEIGELAEIRGWGPKLDGKHLITDIFPYGHSESGVMVRIAGYHGPIDIGWLTKIENAPKV